ncbi:MAG: hypothetical protein IPH53_21125 [Flavobacteriales bacterium]|nr:hypothetical protein [Flavobacteriales bacterium]
MNIPLSLWERLRRADTTLTADRHFHATGIDATPVELPVARIHRCTIGASTFGGRTSVHVIVQPPSGYFARPDAVGFVSNNWLLRFSRVISTLRSTTTSWSPDPGRYDQHCLLSTLRTLRCDKFVATLNMMVLHGIAVPTGLPSSRGSVLEREIALSATLLVPGGKVPCLVW